MMTLALAVLGVILIDIVLAGDNALVIGALAARLPDAQRQRAIIIGVAVAIAARIFFSMVASWLILIPGLNLIGGALLLWIAYKLWQDQRDDGEVNGSPASANAPTGLLAATWAIVLADLSMSLDNVLGVAAAANGHAIALIFGLVLSMVLMGAAATWIAGLMKRWPWLIYLGVFAIVAVGLKMIAGSFLGAA